MLTTPQVAELLGVTTPRVHQLMAANGIRPTKVGPVYVWTPEEVAALARSRKPVGRPRKRAKRKPKAAPAAA